MQKRSYRPALYFLIAFIVLSFLTEGVAVIHGTGSDREKESEILQIKLDSLVACYRIPGTTFAVLTSDGRLIALSSGLSDREKGIPMEPGDIMFSGSVGKTFVAALVLKLSEEGLINLKERASAYLEHETWFPNVPNAPGITVEMLLNHTAGIPEYVYTKELWREEKNNPDRVWSVRERLSYIFGKSAANYPGGGWNYSDSHYLLLGLILEKVMNKSYYSLLDSLVLTPCGLTSTWPADHRDIAELIPGYTALSKELYLPEKMVSGGKYAFNPQLEWTGGGVVTNVSDLATWAKQLYGGGYLNRLSLLLMTTPVPFRTGLPDQASYGLGCMVGETDGVRFQGHSGFVPGYLTIMQYLPEKELSVAMQVNTDSLHGAAFQELFNVMKRSACSLCPGRSTPPAHSSGN
jgi:D-alanyl-D-alanine carboxypeptidase